YERGRAQDRLLGQLLNECSDPNELSLNAAISTLQATLPPLPALREDNKPDPVAVADKPVYLETTPAVEEDADYLLEGE
ncbi:hypothetical protein, partial [Dyella sp.]|uniref:hypothetical protein n=1 Tax=Dyella sp. TaxID=1869338 RepID=UPI002D7752E3